MGWKARKAKKPVYSKAVVEGWVKRMKAEKLSINKLAALEGVAGTTVTNKLAALEAGELE